jgi:hypothetical protein
LLRGKKVNGGEKWPLTSPPQLIFEMLCLITHKYNFMFYLYYKPTNCK